MATATLLTVPEVAEQLRMSPWFVRAEYRRGNLRGSKFGGALRFTSADVEAYRQAHLNVAPSPASSRRRRR